MGTRETDLTMDILFRMEEIRQILRDSAPMHKLSDSQKKEAEKILASADKELRELAKILGVKIG